MIEQTLEARRAIVEMAVHLADKGYLAGTGGNIALRIDASHFAVTPSAVDYYSMSVDDICVLQLHDLTQRSGRRSPSVESALHAQILKSRPDCVASIHTHQPIASAYTLLNKILPVSDGGLRSVLGGDVPVAAYAPSGTSWLAKHVSRLVRPGLNAYLMRNHGVVCLGADLGEAARVVEALEEAASAWFKARGALSRQAAPPSATFIKTTSGMFREENSL